ncbi:olfactory receptor 5L2-like [Pteropus medius]|uniref:olfactory receptor 5L2-like n=1 Tax=Pteropus vampyrus TaxID=132908 RepID=UPI00196A5621|nr:olfactory receptor 5L2-like [Pteropus giganteus]
MAAVRNEQKLNGLQKQRFLFPYGSGGWKWKISFIGLQSSFWQGCVVFRGSRKRFVYCFFQLLLTAGIPWLASAVFPNVGCMAQFYLFCAYGITEVFLPAVMAYDRFVAICNPLLYMVTMSQNLCVELVSGCYLCGTVCSLIHLCLALEITSYRSNVMNHFFCDLPPLLSLACSDVTLNELMLYIVATFNELITIVIILTSYLFILITILRMRSAEGRRKAFSTCASHLTAIVVLQGTILFTYCRPSSGNSEDTDKVATVFYTVVIPMLNPLIYSLRNKDVKEASRKVLSSNIFSQRIFSWQDLESPTGVWWRGEWVVCSAGVERTARR